MPPRNRNFLSLTVDTQLAEAYRFMPPAAFSEEGRFTPQPHNRPRPATNPPAPAPVIVESRQRRPAPQQEQTSGPNTDLDRGAKEPGWGFASLSPVRKESFTRPGSKFTNLWGLLATREERELKLSEGSAAIDGLTGRMARLSTHGTSTAADTEGEAAPGRRAIDIGALNIGKEVVSATPLKTPANNRGEFPNDASSSSTTAAGAAQQPSTSSDSDTEAHEIAALWEWANANLKTENENENVHGATGPPPKCTCLVCTIANLKTRLRRWDEENDEFEEQPDLEVNYQHPSPPLTDLEDLPFAYVLHLRDSLEQWAAYISESLAVLEKARDNYLHEYPPTEVFEIPAKLHLEFGELVGTYRRFMRARRNTCLRVRVGCERAWRGMVRARLDAGGHR